MLYAVANRKAGNCAICGKFVEAHKGNLANTEDVEWKMNTQKNYQD